MFDRINKNTSRRGGANPRNCAHFLHDRSGVAAVEFGMIALPFLLLILAILEYGYGNFAQARLDAAVARTARQIMTGAVQGQTVAGAPLTAQQFHDQILCKNLPALLKCSDIYVDVMSFKADSAPNYDAFVNASKSGIVPAKLNNTNSYCIGGKSDYVVLRVAYPAPVLTTSLVFPNTVSYKGRKTRLLTSTASFKNEPFNATPGC